MFPHTEFDERADKSIDLPRITVLREDEVLTNMVHFAGGDFTMGTLDFGPAVAPPHPRYVRPFYLDETEVTISKYREKLKGIPTKHRAISKSEDEAVRLVTYDEAVLCAELLGKRLPTEAEYEFAATNGGTQRFPWGNDAERIRDWTFGPVRSCTYDRTPTTPPVWGLFSNAGEWTSSWHVPYPRTPWPADIIAELTDERIVRGGPLCVLEAKAQPQGEHKNEPWDARYRKGISRALALPGLGFRCARSSAGVPRPHGK
jgi:formylglycine-generating enzyme required for sulfatase activity